MVAYLSNGLQDVYDLGFTAAAFVTRPRMLDADAGDFLDPTTGIFYMLGHGFAPDDAVWFMQIAAGSLPAGAGLTLADVYTPQPIDARRFRLAPASGGPALTFADVGIGWSLQRDPERRLLRIAENVSRDLDQDLTAHATPILPVNGKFPDKLVGVCARETARRGAAGLTFENAQFRTAKERTDALQGQDDDQRASWRMGQPISPRPVDQTSAPDNAARATNGVASGCVAPMSWVTGVL